VWIWDWINQGSRALERASERERARATAKESKHALLHAEVVLEDVELPRHLREDQHARALLLQLRQQLCCGYVCYWERGEGGG
jgi:hypothetical protein